MKKLILAALCAAPLTFSLMTAEPRLAVAQSGNEKINPTTMSWQIVTENTDGSPATDLAGYTIECSTVSGGYKNATGSITVVEIADPYQSSQPVKDIVTAQATYYCAMRAFNSKRFDPNWDASVAWSGYSNEVSFTINEYGIVVYPPKVPGALAVH